MEAPKGSGALITADHALTEGRDVFVHGACLGSARNAGGDALASQGAVIVNNAEDILPNGRRAGAGSRRGPNPEQVETEDYGEAKANMKHSTQEAVGDSLVASNASAEMPAKKATVAKPAAKKPAKKKPAKKSAASSKQAKKTEKGRTLVIVESPAKAKTIEKYLGSKYKVLASMGLLIDLPKSRIGVDVNNNSRPEYLTIRGRASVLRNH